MVGFVFRRSALALATVFASLLVTFLLFRALPTDVAQHLGGERATPELLDDLRWSMGLDRPLIVNLPAAREDGLAGLFRSQLGQHLHSALTLDFGRSWTTRREVGEMIRSGLGPTLAISLPLFLGVLTSAASCGVLAAARRGRRPDRWILAGSIVLLNLPLVALIPFAQYVFAYRLDWFPLHGFDGPNSVVLPVLIGVVAGWGGNVRFYRTVLLEEVDRDHVVTATAKGIGRARVLFAHALANPLVPVLTRLSWVVPSIFFGSLLLERAFDIPGTGRLLVDAITTRDLPVVNAITVLMSALTAFAALAGDRLCARVDPRFLAEVRK